MSIEYLEKFFSVKGLKDVTPTLLEDFKTWLIHRTEKSLSTKRKKQAKLRGVLGPHGVNRTFFLKHVVSLLLICLSTSALPRGLAQYTSQMHA